MINLREILFRGKKEYSNEWAYGYVSFTKSGKIYLNNPNGASYTLIKPETLGQFTGAYDKNDKRVFEGDIVKTKDGLYRVEYMITPVVPGVFVGFGLVSMDGSQIPSLDGLWPMSDIEVVDGAMDERDLNKEGDCEE